METRIIDLHITKVAIRKIPGAFDIKSFENVNSLVHGQTILLMLEKMMQCIWIHISRHAEYRTLLREGKSSVKGRDIENNILRNINMILEDESLDIKIEPNRVALKCILLDGHISSPELYDKLFTRYKINPDIFIGHDSICPNQENSNRQLSKKELNVFIKHGAQCERAYMFYSPRGSSYDIILQRTPFFHRLKDLFIKDSHGYVNPRLIPVFEHIFAYGKYSSILFYQEIHEFDVWIKNLKHMKHTAFTTENIIHPAMKKFAITDNKRVSELTKCMIVYKNNLEVLTKNEITMPAYRFHHIAVIFTYLISNTNILAPDVLRKILTFVFS